MITSANHNSAEAPLPVLRTLHHQALAGDRQAARALIHQGVPLLPELLDSLLQTPSPDADPRHRQRLLILMGRLAAHWPDQLLAALDRLPWRQAPASAITGLLRCLEAVTGRQQEQVIDMALEIISEPEDYAVAVRLPAAELLARLPRPRSAEILWWALVNDPDWRIKQVIIQGMETRPLLRAPEAIPALSQLHLDRRLAAVHPELVARADDLLHRLRSEMLTGNVLESQVSEMLL